MVTKTEASPAGQTPSEPDATAQVLAHPAVLEAIAAREREVEARVEAHWKGLLDKSTREMGAKQGTWGLKEKDYQTKLDEAEAKLEAAKLSDDQESIARSRVQLLRLQREAQAVKQEFEEKTQERDRAQGIREIYLDIKEAWPGLPAKFWEEARRKLGEGVPSYVIEREARSQTPSAAKTQPKGTEMPVALPGTGRTDGVTAYQQALKDGKPLPSAQEIDQITSRYR